MSEFCHLHVHNEYSLLDGIGTAEDYAKRAAELKHTHLALTNHGNVDGSIKFQNACKASGVKSLQGFEGYIVPDISVREKGEKCSHITLLAKNNTGWQNILKMITISNLEGFYYRPRLSPDILKAHSDGVVVMSACASTFIREEWGVCLLKELKDITDVFLEIMPLDYSAQREINQLCIKLGEELGIKIVATNDCHYVNDSDSKLQEVLLAMQSKKRWTDKDRWKFDVNDLFLKTKREMISSFQKQGCVAPRKYREAIENTMLVASLCEGFVIDEIPVSLPLPPEVRGKDPVEFFNSLCEAGMNNIIRSNSKKSKRIAEYEVRLAEEKEVIIKQGFCVYFLIVWELMKWCRENDIMVGPGRGSSGGSLICYLLGITMVDPIEFKLVFARFISPARIDLPDIDMDFEDTKRYKIREHFEEIYGKYNVAGVSTFGMMKGRSAIRDVSRVFSIPIPEVNKASSCIVVRSGGDFRSDYTIEDAFNTFEDGIKFKKKYPEVTDIATRIEGQIKSRGMHAAAMVISAEDLREGKRASLLYGKDKQLIVNYEKNDIEHVGLMKLDVLGINALTVLNNCRKMIKINHGVDIVFEEIELDDKAVFEEFTKGNNVGCFQVGSLGLRRFCQQIGVDDFMMLVHASSLFRPGTLRSGMTTEFVSRKKGEKEWKYKHPLIEKITKDTFGVILYQEQVMSFMYDLGGLGWKTADTVRKVISKSQGVDQFNKFKDLFAEGCEKRGTLSKRDAEELWNELSSFGSYGFNLSHAVEYSLITYWDMWLKIHYPQEFMCASLTSGSDEKKDELVEEAIRMGIDVRPPKIGISKAHEWVLREGILYCPFIEIKGFGEKTSESAANIGSIKKEKTAGFFDTGAKKEKGLTARFINMLNDIGAYNDCEVDDDEAERIKKYFQFDFSKDRSRKFKYLQQVLSGSINFSSIKDCEFGKIDKTYKYYFGHMTEIKFGYRSKVNVKDVKNVAGVADNLGGVYGNLKDSTDFCMIVFGSDIYQKKKDLIEHCQEDFIIAKANNPAKTGSIHCQDAWFKDEILAGELNGLGLSLHKRKRFRNKELLLCEDCELRKECRVPVLPSVGNSNVMIIGEAPGKDEDRLGLGFSGAAGKVMWDALEKYNLERRDFHVTNVVKCFPSISRTPSKKHINHCRKWLDEEIGKISPYAILAFGNTCLNYFTGVEKGIMDKSGKTEWIDSARAWVCWCIHPASVLYHQENKSLFDAGIENFSNKIKVLGGF